MFLTSCNVQSKIPKVGVSTGTAKQLWAICLFKADSSDFHILRTLLKYSDETLSLLTGPLYENFHLDQDICKFLLQ